ncbi:MAG: hypothetical protein RLZZ434_1046, partial [Pseudomonadota bacterium]
ISDLEESLVLMQRHHIVPVVLWDSTEYMDLPEFGITNVTDPETGAKRTLFLRKAYREQILQSFEPFFVENHFDADLLTDYFHQYVAA